MPATDTAPALADSATAIPAPAGRLAALATDWYQTNARDLPWRQPGTTPWGVLVSEVMLQQTPVARVTPVWVDWMQRWPQPADLAAESAGDVIRAWGKLGYPRRALRLHECARDLVRSHDGRVPDDVDALLALPGIGAYTARAVAAFAYGQRHPVVDINVRRLIARSLLGRAQAAPAATVRDLRAVERVLPTDPDSAARASMAFMELGALVCTATRPRCDLCPLQSRCTWLDAGSPPHDGPPTRKQTYAGTDRQVRGLLLDVLRGCVGPVERSRLDLVWPQPDQRDRALASLIADGLVVPTVGGHYALPGQA